MRLGEPNEVEGRRPFDFGLVVKEHVSIASYVQSLIEASLAIAGLSLRVLGEA